MQSLTVPASIAKRKQACKSCRQRKKRCDGERPTCALCKKWELKCEYTVPASNGDPLPSSVQYTATLFGRQPFPPLELGYDGAPDSMQLPDVHFGLPELSEVNGAPLPLPNGYPTPASGLDSITMSNVLDADQDLLSNTGLPSGATLDSLIDIFFRDFYHVFPCFHKATFLAEVQDQRLQAEAPILLYAICTVASNFHPDPEIKAQQNNWYEQAKFLYELTGRDPHPALRTIQAVLCLVFHSYTKGDFSTCWLYLGKAWRQVSAQGMNRMDSSHAVVMALDRKDTGADSERRGAYNRMEWEGRTAIEKEECRRTLWLLFMIDRNHSWPTGWPNAIEERQFKIDIPVAESVFQALTAEMDVRTVNNIPFTRNLNAMVASTSAAKTPLNLFHYLVVAHVLLGRVTELIHSLHDAPDTPEYAQECDDLDATLVKLRLSLPRSATSILEAPSSDRGHIIWLNLTLNTISILLHYRAAGLTTPPSPEPFTLALTAAKSTAHFVQDTARISTTLLLSAHIASSLYISACVLIIHWRLTGDVTCNGDIDLFALVFERMNDVFSVMGKKFGIALKRDIERDMEEIRNLRERGFKGLLADCSKWGFVQAEVRMMGINMT